MRGTRAYDAGDGAQVGIIPAYAGNTRTMADSTVCGLDHPRICGEHHAFRHPCRCSLGSSPHMRGTLPSRTISSRGVGIIPAYAGNTRCASSGVRSSRDHPRICGEHFTCDSTVSDYVGSSPHMRGTPCCGEMSGHESGIIPAYAGNTRRAVCLCVFRGDHPRICGEHYFIITDDGFQVGSSPHMRGTLRSPCSMVR